jgi:hypothetical protein
MSEKKKQVKLDATSRSIGSGSNRSVDSAGARPIVPADVTEKFLVPTKITGAKNKTVYRPAILCQSSIHFVKSTAGVDYWQDVQYMIDIEDEIPDPLWDNAHQIEPDVLQLSNQPEDGFSFAELPPEMSSAKNYVAWEKSIKDYFFRHVQCTVYSCKALKKTTAPGMSETDARIELAHAAKEARDEAVDKLKTKFSEKLRSLQTRMLAAQQRLDKEKQEAKAKQYEGMFNIGTTILGALLGNKIASKSNVSKAASAVKGLGKVTAQQGDVMRAQETYEELSNAKDELERQCQEEIDTLTSQYSVENLALEAVDIPLRKADTKIKLIALIWVPWQVNPQGIATKLIG